MAEDNIAESVLAADRLSRALKLRVRGANWTEIARECGYPSPATALRAVGEAMAAATQRAEETADQLRNTANLQLDYLLGETLRMMDQDVPDTYDADGNPLSTDDRAVKLRAVDEARRLVESKAKLNRLGDKTEGDGDAPMRIQIVGLDPQDMI